MPINEFYPYTGLLSFVLTWFAILYVLHKNPRELNKSISHHAAKDMRIYKLFAIIMSFALFFLAIYLFLFLIPTLNLHMLIISLFIIAIIIELLATWVPLTDDRRFHPHAVLSNTAAFLMPLITTGLIVLNHLSNFALTVAYIGLVIMIGLLMIFFTIPKARENYLIYQSMYIIAFQLTMTFVPFLT